MTAISRPETQGFETPLDVDRFGRDGLVAFWEQWRIDLAPLQDDISEAGHAAIAFIQSCLKAGYMLNGGALIALPLFVLLLGGATAEGAGVFLYAVSAFVIGLTCCGFANLVAVITMRILALQLEAALEWRLVNLREKYHAEKISGDARNRIFESQEEENKLGRFHTWLSWAGVGLFVASLTAFVSGSMLGWNALADSAILLSGDV